MEDLESQSKAKLTFNENIFNGIVERITAEENKLHLEIKSVILLKDVTEFDDAIIHRIVNVIHVTKDLNLRIFIKGGAEIVQTPFLPAEELAR